MRAVRKESAGYAYLMSANNRKTGHAFSRIPMRNMLLLGDLYAIQIYHYSKQAETVWNNSKF